MNSEHLRKPKKARRNIASGGVSGRGREVRPQCADAGGK